MARQARKKSSMGIYNIMLRGTDKIFREESDYDELIERMATYFMGDAVIYAYCLMDNTVCFILRESEKGVSNDIKAFVTSYARYYNSKYEITGSVFADRFKSEPIDDKKYLCASVVTMHRIYEIIGCDAYTGDDDLLNDGGLCAAKEVFKLIGGKKKYISEMEKDVNVTPFYHVLIK